MEWTPEIIEKVPADQYHRQPGVSPSRAKYALESALAYQYAMQTPFVPSDEMELGTACHFAVWEPDMLPLRCVVWEGGQRRGKTWDAFEAANSNKIILTENQFGVVLKVRDRCQSHAKIREVLNQRGKREVSMRWNQNGLKCRGRVDDLSTRINDLKTSYSITDRAIAKSVTDRFYHLQCGAYQMGYEAITGETIQTALIFAQTKPPYDARVLIVDGDEIERGRKLWTRALEVIAEAESTGTYPGIDEDESLLILPEWALDNGEQLTLTLDGESIGM